MKTAFSNGIFGLLAVFGLIFISCPDGNFDEWIKISSVNDIAGKWENSFIVNVPATGDYNASFAAMFGAPIPATSVSYENYLLEYIKNGDALTVSSKIDFNTLLKDVTNTTPAYTKDSLWANLISFYEPVKNIYNITIEEYYVIQEVSSFVSDLDISSFYINEDKTKLKMAVPLSGTYKKEIILNKKYKTPAICDGPGSHALPCRIFLPKTGRREASPAPGTRALPCRILSPKTGGRGASPALMCMLNPLPQPLTGLLQRGIPYTFGR
jgi:hypothetical protein